MNLVSLGPCRGQHASTPLMSQSQKTWQVETYITAFSRVLPSQDQASWVKFLPERHYHSPRRHYHIIKEPLSRVEGRRDTFELPNLSLSGATKATHAENGAFCLAWVLHCLRFGALWNWYLGHCGVLNELLGVRPTSALSLLVYLPTNQRTWHLIKRG
jgi:hypothetical protein